ncbi:MAG: helicase [Bathelium mastoideum]|nr:MAG: helicase [Bathelium mastoideum]
MTRRDSLRCIHEPFGDAYYFGPERLAERYMNDENSRIHSGYQNTTYKDVLDRIAQENTEGKRVFIKDMAQYLMPPDGKPASIAPSLHAPKRGIGTCVPSQSSLETSAPLLSDFAKPQHNTASRQEGGKDDVENGTAEQDNPTVIPETLLQQFHFTFLIRHPRFSIPSYYRCTVPPLDSVTGFYNFMPSEAGYAELRRFFDYLRQSGQVGPQLAGQLPNGHNGAANGHTARTPPVDICVIDADDILDNPEEMIEAFCKSTGIKFDPKMLNWDNEEDQRVAQQAFAKWVGFHDDAVDSKELKPRAHKKKVKSGDEYYQEWKARYGDNGARVIRETVDQNVADYEYLKQFALKV